MGLRKPDIVAPGTDIVSCNSRVRRTLHGWQNAYMAKSGTSMSSAAVSGILACYLEKHPGATNRDIKLRIRECARDLGYPMNVQGADVIIVSS